MEKKFTLKYSLIFRFAFRAVDVDARFQSAPIHADLLSLAGAGNEGSTRQSTQKLCKSMAKVEEFLAADKVHHHEKFKIFHHHHQHKPASLYVPTVVVDTTPSHTSILHQRSLSADPIEACGRLTDATSGSAFYRATLPAPAAIAENDEFALYIRRTYCFIRSSEE